MKAIHRVRVLPLVPPSLAAQPVEPESPERHVVAVTFAVPLSDGESEQGLLSGQRVMGGPRGALELVRGEVPEAACPGLEKLADELRQLHKGDGPEPPLPQPERVGDLPAKTQRIDWLPVGRTAHRVEQVRHRLNAGGKEQGQEIVEAARQGTPSILVLEHGPRFVAHCGVEIELAAAPRWDDAIRERLRRAAEAPDGEAGSTPLAERLQAQEDRCEPSLHGRQGLALALRKQIVPVAGPHQEEARP